MQKKFLSSLLLLLSLNLLIKPAWIFGIDLEVQNRVGAAQYGLYAAILSFTYIFNIILDLGLTHFNNQAIARQPAEVAKNFSKLTSLKVFLGLVYLLVAVVIGWFLGYTSHTFLLLLVLTVSQFLASFLLFLRSHLAGLHLFKTDSLMSVLDKLLMIIACGVLLFTELLPRDFTVVDFALAQLGSYLLAVLIAFFLVLQKARVFNWKFDLKDYLRNLKLSFPYALLIFLMAMYTRVDSIMLEQIKGAFEAGIYAQAFRLLDAVNQVGYLFSVLLLPMFSGMFARKENIVQLTRLSFSLIFVATLAVSLSGFYSASAIMGFLYDEHSALSTPVFQLLVVSSIAFGSTYVFGTLLTARGNLGTLNKVALAGFLLNVVLNLLLIPYFGATGAATATVATQFLTAIVQVLLSFRLARFHFKMIFWLRMVGYLFVAFMASWGLQHLGLNWAYLFVLNLAVVVLIAFVFKLFHIRAAIELIVHRLR